MRLIASFDKEKHALGFHTLLAKEGVENTVEQIVLQKTKKPSFLVWVVSEDDIDKSIQLLDAFKKNLSSKPSSMQPEKEESSEAFPAKNGEKQEEPPSYDPGPPAENEQIKGPIRVKAGAYYFRMRMNAPVTRWVVIICSVLFLWNAFQKSAFSGSDSAFKAYSDLKPMNFALMYDVPLFLEGFLEFIKSHPDIDLDDPNALSQEEITKLNKINSTPFFNGFYDVLLHLRTNAGQFSAEMFRKIREGQVWRLFTPCLMHGDFLHILFNMLWLWMLGRQVEQKIQKARYIILMLLIGIVSNTFQYLMGGPFFLGYSGVVAGLGGFIWLRQKKAPWEGYNIPAGTLIILFVYIFVMLGLQIISFFLLFFDIAQFSFFRIANTAHVVGLFTGLVFAKVPYFYKVNR